MYKVLYILRKLSVCSLYSGRNSGDFYEMMQDPYQRIAFPYMVTDNARVFGYGILLYRLLSQCK